MASSRPNGLARLLALGRRVGTKLTRAPHVPRPSSVPDGLLNLKSSLVSVLVCTRNRGSNALPTVQSILANGHQNVELLVLDQSDDTATRDALKSVSAEDSRLRYYHLETPGKARSLNFGLSLLRGQFVLLTDDDCEVMPDWIEAALLEFERDPSLGCVFGRVEAGKHEASEGYVPICTIREPRTIYRVRDFLTMPGWGNAGMGANMALRSTVLSRLRGWDECIGPGAKFGSGDDHDLSVRLLRAGYPIRFSPAPRVVHFGFRRWHSAGHDHRRIAFGVGGVFAKHLRCRAFYRGGIRVPLYQLRESGGLILRGSRPHGLSYVASWTRGFAAGLVHALERDASQFVPGQDASSGRHASNVAEVVLRRDQLDATHR